MRITPVLILSLASLPVVAGNIYKWTDAQGQVHYSQTPPKRGPVTVKPQGSVQPGVSLQAPAAPAKVSEQAKTDAATAAESTEAKAKRCAESKQRLVFLEENPARRLMVQTADGSEARMTEEQHEQSVTKAQAAGKGC